MVAAAAALPGLPAAPHTLTPTPLFPAPGHGATPEKGVGRPRQASVSFGRCSETSLRAAVKRRLAQPSPAPRSPGAEAGRYETEPAAAPRGRQPGRLRRLSLLIRGKGSGRRGAAVTPGGVLAATGASGDRGACPGYPLLVGRQSPAIEVRLFPWALTVSLPVPSRYSPAAAF